MEKQDFSNFVIKLARFYDKKDFLTKSTDNQGRFGSWYQKVKHLPGGQALNDIYDRITDEYERFPANLPKAIKTHWGAWKNENQDKIIRSKEKITGCENCLRGWINFAQEDEKSGLIYEYTCLCGHCRQIKNQKIPMMTVEQIEAEGGRVIKPGREKPKKQVFGSIEDMTAAVGGGEDNDQVPF